MSQRYPSMLICSAKRVQWRQWVLIPLAAAGLWWAAAGENALAAARGLHCETFSFPPYSFQGSSGLTGSDVDLMRAAARRAGISITIRMVPVKRMLLDAQYARVDCAFSLFYTPERGQRFEYSVIPLYTAELTVFSVRGGTHRVAGVDDLIGHRVGYLRAASVTPEIDAAVREKRLQALFGNDVEQVFRLLQVGRVDYAIFNRNAGLWALANLPGNNIVPLSPPLKRTPAFTVYSTTGSRFVVAIDRALQDMREDGTFARIEQKFRLKSQVLGVGK